MGILTIARLFERRLSEVAVGKSYLLRSVLKPCLLRH